MIVTTTQSVEGYRITGYYGIVFGEVVTGVNFLRDIGAGLRNVFGGRSAGYENELEQARNKALREMEERAAKMARTPSSALILTTRSSVRATCSWSPQAAPPSPWKRRSNENEGSTDGRALVFSSCLMHLSRNGFQANCGVPPTAPARPSSP